MSLTVRELQLADADLIINYFHQMPSEELAAIGIDANDLREPKEWKQWFEANIYQSLYKVTSYFLIWELDTQTIGFTFIDRIIYGSDAYMHVFMLQGNSCENGHGQLLIKQSAQLFFDLFKFDCLYSEPYALNTAVQRALQCCQFKYLQTHQRSSPEFCYKAPVTKWVLAN